MSAFDDHYAELARPLLKERFGDPITYTDENGTATTLTAVVGAESAQENPDDDGQTIQRTRHVTLFKNDVATVAKRSGKASVTIAGEVWPIVEILTETPTETQVQVERIEKSEVSRPGFRKE